MTKTRLFKEDFDDLVCKILGKRKDLSRQRKKEIMKDNEKFAAEMGVKEINRMLMDILIFKEKNEESFAAEPLLEFLEDFENNLLKIRKILTGDLNIEKIVEKHGDTGYKQLVRYRKQLIELLKEKYTDVSEDE